MLGLKQTLNNKILSVYFFRLAVEKSYKFHSLMAIDLYLKNVNHIKIEKISRKNKFFIKNGTSPFFLTDK
jgi:hypothetical protein